MNNHRSKTNRWAMRLLAIGVCAALALLAYILSIGPVYYLWARYSADMTTHEKIEGLYSPLLVRGPRWLKTLAIDFRDVSRIAGHQATQ